MAADLAKYDRRWALVGGFAVFARADPRFTRDIDVTVAVADDADGEGLVPVGGTRAADRASHAVALWFGRP
jgi:hypothetical protein